MKIPNTIYFLGIGGIGMSSLARYFNRRGSKVLGYDRTSSELTSEMIKEGISIHFTDSPDLIPNEIDLIVYTPAIPKNLMEFIHLSQWPDKIKKRSEVLGELTASHKNIAIAGTHGKTTTSVLLSQLLDHCKISFTAFLGGISKSHHSNLIDKGDSWMVEEADEFDRSFLQLRPDIAVIGSLDADHLDIYGDRMKMVESYLEFARKIKSGGILFLYQGIAETEIEEFRNVCNPKVKVLTYGPQLDADIQIKIQQTEQGWMNFDYRDETGFSMNNLKIRLPGIHNASNAGVAIRIAMEVKASENNFEYDIKMALSEFKGIDRRFEWKYETENNVLIEDYAHHPSELAAAIQAARDCYPKRKLTGIFQPHLYTRTRDFATDFAKVLDTLDEIILVELYPARENPIEGIGSETILNLMQNSAKHYILKADLVDQLTKLKTDVILILGAGDLDLLSSQIVKNLK